MNEEAIRSLIRQFHATLDGAKSVTAKDREQLEQLSADIQALLAKPEVLTLARHQPVRDQLLAAVTRFEISHPDLAATLAQVSKALGDMGI